MSGEIEVSFVTPMTPAWASALEHWIDWSPSPSRSLEPGS